VSLAAYLFTAAGLLHCQTLKLNKPLLLYISAPDPPLFSTSSVFTPVVGDCVLTQNSNGCKTLQDAALLKLVLTSLFGRDSRTSRGVSFELDMMSCSIAVRNLTSVPFSIKRVEQFEEPNTLQTSSSGYFLGARNTTSAAHSTLKLGEHAESFPHQEMDVTLAPFESYTLGQTESNSDETWRKKPALRLTIETPSGASHHIAIHPSSTQKSSKLSTPLSPASSTTYTALFHPSKPTPHLTIHTNHLPNYANWMSTLPDDIPLSSLSIPGTHNSHTHYRALPSVRCQTVDIKTQLEHGIRFLDIRCQPAHASDVSRKDFVLVHGAFPISLTGPKYFAPILQTCYEFLEKHPSETILMSLKREGIGAATDAHFAHVLLQHYVQLNAAKWYTSEKIPCLRDIRGKIVLIRRFKVDENVGVEMMGLGLGLDATAWPHNAVHALLPNSTDPFFCLQDYCDVFVPESIPSKIQHVNQHLARAAAAVTYKRVGPMYLNFLSASNFWKRACWPENIARIVNREVEEWVCVGHGLENAPAEGKTPGKVDDHVGMRRKGEGDAGTGVVVMDFVGEGGDWELVRLVVGMNMGILNRMQNER
jgi:1-phosphatidylinositol phosphodiesterase